MGFETLSSCPLSVLKWGYFFLLIFLSLEISSFQTCINCAIFLFQVQHVGNDPARDPSCLLVEVSVTSIKSRAVIGYPSGQDGAILPVSLERNLFLIPYNKSFIDLACGQDGGILASFCFWVLMDLDYSRSINTQKKTWPISSHLDLTLGQ